MYNLVSYRCRKAIENFKENHFELIAFDNLNEQVIYEECEDFCFRLEEVEVYQYIEEYCKNVDDGDVCVE